MLIPRVWTSLIELLDTLHGRCLACGEEHDWKQCSKSQIVEEGKGEVRQMIEWVRQERLIKSRSGCQSCGLPSMICRRWQEGKQGAETGEEYDKVEGKKWYKTEGKKYYYGTILFEMVLLTMIWGEKDWVEGMEAWLKEEEVDWKDKEAMLRWLSQESEVGRIGDE